MSLPKEETKSCHAHERLAGNRCNRTLADAVEVGRCCIALHGVRVFFYAFRDPWNLDRV